MSKKLIGLAGKAGAGKDTVADYLWEKEGAIKIAFADALRAAATSIFGDDIWLKRWFLSYSAVRDTDHVVVPDVRFDVEAEAIRHLGGTIVHIVRPGAGLSGAASGHSSEAGIELRNGDMYLSNRGSVEDLRHKVDELWGYIK